jgi:acetylglutamate kinase
VGGVPQPSVAASEIETLIESGHATNGMAAKLRAAARALRTGARGVRIGDLTLLSSRGAGTRIFAAAPQPA